MKMRILLVIFILLFSGCLNEHKPKKFRGKILMVIAPKNFRDEELFIPKKIFEDNGYEVEVVSTTKGIHVGMLGGIIETNKTIYEINNISQYSALVIPGGIGSKEYLWNNKKLQDIVREFYKENKVIGAICLSPVILAKAGILKGKKATVFPDKEAIEELKKGGAIYIDKGVVVDGNIVTAKSPKYAKEFGEEIIKLLSQEGNYENKG